MNSVSISSFSIFEVLLIVIVLVLIIGLVFRAIMPRQRASALIAGLLGIVGAVAGFFACTLLIAGIILVTGAPFSERLILIGIPIFTLAGLIMLPVWYARKSGRRAQAAPHENPTPAATSQFTTKNPPASPQHEFQIKICPACKRTFSDITLNFCLDDGAQLSNVLNVLADYDPEETVLSPKIR